MNRESTKLAWYAAEACPSKKVLGIISNTAKDAARPTTYINYSLIFLTIMEETFFK